MRALTGAQPLYANADRKQRLLCPTASAEPPSILSPAYIVATAAAGMAQQHADQPAFAATAPTSSPRIRGILKTPRSCLKSAPGSQTACMMYSTGGNSASSYTAASPLTQAPNADAFFLQLDSSDGSKQIELTPTASNDNSSKSRKQKHALFIDPACVHEDNNGACSNIAKSVSSNSQTPVMQQTASPKQHIRVQVPTDAQTALTAAPWSPRSPTQQQQRTSINHGEVSITSSTSRRISTAPPADTAISAITPSSRSRSSLLAILPPKSRCSFSSSGSPPTSPTSSRFSQLCLSPRARSCPNASILSSSGSSSSGAGGGTDSSSGKQYGTAWYLKSHEWNYVTKNLQNGSTWHRESQHVKELDEQQRFIQQLQLSVDPASSSGSGSNHHGISSGSSSIPAPAALEAVIQGLGSSENPQALAGLSHEVLAANTWVMSKQDASNHEAADAAAVQAAQQYYRQLQATAKQQAALNDKVKGSFALRAYKDFMRSKGYRQAACFQRLPTPTDEDIRLAKVKELQYWKKVQQRLRLHHKQQQQQPEKAQLQELIQHWQLQPKTQQGAAAAAAAAAPAAVRLSATAAASGAPMVGVSNKGPTAAAAAAVAAFRAAAVAAPKGTSVSQSGTASAVHGTEAALTAATTTAAACTDNADATAPVAATTQPAAAVTDTAAAAAAVPVVPRLDLNEVTRVTRRLHELKSSCHPESGLTATDFELLEALLTGGRQALPGVETAAASCSGRLGSSSGRLDSSSGRSGSSGGRLGSSSGCLSSRGGEVCSRMGSSPDGTWTGVSRSRMGSSSSSRRSSSKTAFESGSRQPWTCFFTSSGCGGSNSSRMQVHSRDGGYFSQKTEQQQQRQQLQQVVLARKCSSGSSSSCQGVVASSIQGGGDLQKASQVAADSTRSAMRGSSSSSGTAAAARLCSGGGWKNTTQQGQQQPATDSDWLLSNDALSPSCHESAQHQVMEAQQQEPRGQTSQLQSGGKDSVCVSAAAATGKCMANSESSAYKQQQQQQTQHRVDKLHRMEDLPESGKSHTYLSPDAAAAAYCCESSEDIVSLSITGSRLFSCTDIPSSTHPGTTNTYGLACRGSVSASPRAIRTWSRPQQQQKQQQQQQESPRLTSRGSPSQVLSPHVGTVLENVPGCVSYTLTKGRSAAYASRASSPGKASSSAGTVGGHATCSHLHLPPCSR